jgi:hypothetical protein
MNFFTFVYKELKASLPPHIEHTYAVHLTSPQITP